LSAATVRMAMGNELQVVRETRLFALAQEPECFGTASAAEPPLWQWLSDSSHHDWFVAWMQSKLVGIGAIFFDDTSPDDAPQLGAMWVEKEHRHLGLGHAIETAAERRVVERGFDAIGLWVVEGNWAATRAYESYGYAATGAWKVAPRDSSLKMWRMRRSLPGPAEASQRSPLNESMTKI
jgi:GNAT superfamily N-acetyltransferase